MATLLFLLLWTAIAVIYFYQIIQMKRLASVNGPFVLPIFGSVLQLYFLTWKWNLNELYKIFEIYGPTVQLHIDPFKSLVLTTDPRIAQKIIFSSKENVKSSTYDVVKPWMGDSILVRYGDEKWRMRKKHMAQFLNMPSYLEYFINIFNNESKTLLAELENYENGETFNVYKILTKCAIDTIQEAAFGREATKEVQKSNEYIRSMTGCSIVVMKRVFSILNRFDFVYNRTENGKKFKKYIQTIREITVNIIRRESKLLFNPLQNQRINYVSKILQTRLEGSYNLTDEEISLDTSAFIFAGHDTVSYSLSFACYLLAHHPEVQEKILAEMQEILGDDNNENNPVTMSQLNEMKYLELVIKESLRMYPSVPFIGRKLQEKLELDDIQLPVNTDFLIFTDGMHHNAQYFPNPEQFIPERFLDPEIERMAYVPFSGGPRKCSGYKYAIYEMKVFIINMVRRYTILPSNDGYQPKIMLGITSRPRGGVRIRIERRH